MDFFAMAGLAEAAEAFGALTVIAALGGCVFLFWIALWKKSKIALGCGVALWLGIAWLLQPWHALDGAQFPSDPDEIHWIRIYRGLIAAWLITAAIVSIVVKKYMIKRVAAPEPSNSAPGAIGGGGQMS